MASYETLDEDDRAILSECILPHVMLRISDKDLGDLARGHARMVSLIRSLRDNKAPTEDVKMNCRWLKAVIEVLIEKDPVIFRDSELYQPLMELKSKLTTQIERRAT